MPESRVIYRRGGQVKKRFTGREFIDEHKNLGYHRVQIIKLFNAAHQIFHLSPENLTVVLSTDVRWNLRRNRTPLEKTAVKIGHAIGKGAEGKVYQYVLWVFPSISRSIPVADCPK